jgi:hypothetical protein
MSEVHVVASTARRSAILCATAVVALFGASAARSVPPPSEPSVSVYTEQVPRLNAPVARAVALPRRRSLPAAASAALGQPPGLVVIAVAALLALGAGLLARRRGA